MSETTNILCYEIRRSYIPEVCDRGWQSVTVMCP